MKSCLFIIFSLFLLLSACQKDEDNSGSLNNPPDPAEECDNPIVENKVYQKNGKTYLWAGQDSSTHFDITDWTLEECQLHFGLGREHFKALLDPQYIALDDEKVDLPESEQCILVKGDNNLVKVYPYQYMLAYEALNENVDGEPIMVAYCVLADLAAVYTRIYCEQEITFAVSGYTYFDPRVWGGLDAFVLWDRETESLWWPLIDKGVSGTFKGVLLEKHTESKWEYGTWAEVKEKYPQAVVLDPTQTMAPPEDWPRLTAEELNCE